MERTGRWIIVFFAATTLPLLAQSNSGDALSALLAEVRQLRLVMERSAVIGPQIQLLGTRLAVQNDRVGRAAADHEAVRRELEQLDNLRATLTENAESIDSAIDTEQDRQKRALLIAQQADHKAQLTNLGKREQQIRSRESALADVLMAEQSRWAELNRQLDDLQRTLAK